METEILHESPQELYNFVKKAYPELLNLAIGARLHSPTEKGADYYNHDEKTGYAMRLGRKLTTDMDRLLKIDNKDERLGLAHTFVEVGADLYLAEVKPEVLDVYKESVEKGDMEEVVYCLAGFFDKDTVSVKEAISRFFYFLTPDNFTGVDMITRNCLVPYISNQYHKQITSRGISELVNKAILLTKNTYLDFLDMIVSKVGADLKEIIKEIV